LSYQTLNLQRKESRRLIVLRNSCLLIQDWNKIYFSLINCVKHSPGSKISS
jgi:hypothetical protein